MVLVVAPRGLVCSSTISVVAFGCKRMAVSRTPNGISMTIRSQISPLTLLLTSRRAYVALASQTSTKLSAGLPIQNWSRHRERSFSRCASVEEPSNEMTRKRLSREERTALVESFVRKYHAQHESEFPSLAVVLKETGGSRNVVKDILAEVQGKLSAEFAQKETSATINEFKTKVDEIRQSTSVREACSSTTSLSNTEEEDDEDEDDDLSEEEQEQEQEQEVAETKPVERITTLRRMVGQTPGEINTHSDILSRLRSLGAESLKKKEDPQPTETQAKASEKVAADTLKRTSFAARILPPRHGMFVRFLHPSATEEDLRTEFGDCGEISRVSAVKPMKPNAKFTYGFIDFKTADGLSNALRKYVVIRGHKVETEAAPIQNHPASVPDVVMPKAAKDVQGGSTLIDNLVSKVVSMVPENGSPMKAPGKPSWQDAKLRGRGEDQRLRPRNEFPRHDFQQQRNDFEQQRSDFQQQQQRNDEFQARNAQQFQTNGSPLPSVIPALSDPQKMRRHLAVSVENIAPGTVINQVKDALSVHGEIVAAYLKHRDMSGSSYFFEYLSENDKEKALTAHWLYVNGQQLRVTRADVPKTTVVRVSNVSPSTADGDFLEACKSCGQVERIESRGDRVRDVIFHGCETRNMAKILDRLNEITISSYKLHARPAPRCAYALLNSPDGQEWLSQQIKHLLKNQESLMQQMQIEQRDLRELSIYVTEILSRKPGN